MIVIEKERIKNIPLMTVVDANKKENALPIITYFHGFTSAKEHNLPFAYLLAEKGYRVILPDSKDHGERDEGKSGLKLQLEFWNTVYENLKDLKQIKEFVDEEGLLLDNRFGVAGTSMGGITTAAALTQFPWIKVAAILMGSPKAQEMAKYTIEEIQNQNVTLPFSDEELHKQVEDLKQIDLSHRLDTLKDRPLFFWHGDADKVVPFQQSYSFYEEAKKVYKSQEKIVFIHEKGRAHKVSRPALLEAVKWFEKYL